jgi:hypothetical protein
MNRANLWRASLLMVALTAVACGQETPAESQKEPQLSAREDRVEFSLPQALILGSTVSGGYGSAEAVAADQLGLTPNVVSDAQWASMTAEQFATYQVIILGDAGCVGQSAISAAVANRHVWGPKVNGNIFIAGTAPVANGAAAVTKKAIDFASWRWGDTGLYVSLSCYYQNAAPGTNVALLEPFGQFTVQAGGCHASARVVGEHPALDLSDTSMSNWPCSVGAKFDHFPQANFGPWSVAKYPFGSSGMGMQQYVDGTIGMPYILTRGAQLMGCGDEIVQPSEECDMGYEANGLSGVLCSATCRLNWCGNEIVDQGEDCDEGHMNGYGACPASCRLPAAPPPSRRPPLPSCKHVTLSAGPTCGGLGTSIDNGSTDPDGDLVGCVQSQDYFEIGTSDVVLTCTDSQGQSASCTGSVTIVDDSAPTISCPAARTFECGVGSASPGESPAVAEDNCASPVVTHSMEGGPFSVGTAKSVLWKATDGSNEATCSSSITMVDTLAPALALVGGSQQQLECGAGASYTEPGAQATDKCTGDLSSRVAISGTVNPAAVGLYSRSYRVSDDAGNEASATRQVKVADTRAPVLALNGGAVALECGVGRYTEPGATATDACAGNLSGAIVINNPVNAAAKGAYTVTYSVADGSGNTASAARAVSVSDTLAPSIALVGAASMMLECGVDSFVNPGATAADACSGNLTGAIVTSGAVNAKAPGSYAVRYDVKDGAGLAASAVRTVQVADTRAPVLALNGGAVTVECGVGQYTEPGATATDACAGNLSGAIAISGSVDAAVRGAYTVGYSVADASGNTASLARSVEVKDTRAPSISLVGAASLKIAKGATFVDPGATATDACSGNLSSAIVKTGAVNTAVAGTYTLTYTVQDAVGLSASVSRTVTVEAPSSCRSVVVKPAREIWPPNHKMWSFDLSACAAVVDPCGGPVDINAVGTITSVYSDEVEDANGNGDGHTTGDIVITGDSSFQLRAERQGKGNGRVYGVNFTVTDEAGNTQAATCKFVVPHDQSGRGAIDDGAAAGYTVYR